MVFEVMKRNGRRIRRGIGRIVVLGGVMVSPIAPLTAAAESWTSVVISSRHVTVKDVATRCAPAVCKVVIGRAPPPGSSTLFSRGRVRTRVRDAGKPAAGFQMPRKVRIVAAAERLSMKQWGERAYKHLLADLPAGVVLKSAQGKLPMVFPAGYRLGAIRFPRMPRQSGLWRTTAMIEVLHEDAFLRKVPVVVRLELTQEAVRPHIRRGQGLTLVVERAAASISMQGVAMKDAEVGTILPCRVTKTGKVVRARLRSSLQAIVVETQ